MKNPSLFASYIQSIDHRDLLYLFNSLIRKDTKGKTNIDQITEGNALYEFQKNNRENGNSVTKYPENRALFANN